mmetsp:Transcript_18799/g.48953  ORF Transcript_18799/g.48953 Transcript_18799/m.48953 type:complete len:210 (+) Transcript_18799:2585-3214(+)
MHQVVDNSLGIIRRISALFMDGPVMEFGNQCFEKRGDASAAAHDGRASDHGLVAQLDFAAMLHRIIHHPVRCRHVLVLGEEHHWLRVPHSGERIREEHPVEVGKHHPTSALGVALQQHLHKRELSPLQFEIREACGTLLPFVVSFVFIGVLALVQHHRPDLHIGHVEPPLVPVRQCADHPNHNLASVTRPAKRRNKTLEGGAIVPLGHR